jgi:hypothetical protein
VRTASGGEVRISWLYGQNAATFLVPLSARFALGMMSWVTAESDIVLPPQIVGPSLTVAGFASWVFAHAGREEEAAECGQLQDFIDAALHQGVGKEVRAPRRVVSRAVDLWVEASDLADSWATSTEGKTSADWGLQAERLRVRAQSLRRILGTARREPPTR